jgi:hypothetical protein
MSSHLLMFVSSSGSSGEFAPRCSGREEMEVNNMKVNAEDADDVRPLESQHRSLLRFFCSNHSNLNKKTEAAS